MITRRNLLKGLAALAGPVAIAPLALVKKPKLVTEPAQLSRFIDGQPEDGAINWSSVQDVMAKQIHLFGLDWLVTGIQITPEVERMDWSTIADGPLPPMSSLIGYSMDMSLKSVGPVEAQIYGKART